MKRICTIAAVLIVGLALIAAPSVATAKASTTAENAESEYSIFYSEPSRVDALFAGFIDCIRYNGLIISYDISDVEPEDALHVDKLLGLEDKFGDMPEYWQLRLIYSGEDLDYFGNPIYPSGGNANELLDKMLYVGADDPVSNVLYAAFYVHGKDVLPEEAGLPYLRKAVELAPEIATYHYMLANVLFLLGEFEEGIREVRKGNHAPHNWAFRIFPDSYFQLKGPEIAEVAEWRSKLYFSHWNVKYSNHFTTRKLISLKDRFKEAVIAFNLNGDLEMINDMHRWAIRTGTADGVDVLDALVASVLVGVLTTVTANGGVNQLADETDRRGFERLAEIRSRFRDKVRLFIPKYSFASEYLRSLGSTPNEGKDFFAHIDSIMDGSNRRWLCEREKVSRELRPLLLEMAKFDYTDPAAYRGY